MVLRNFIGFEPLCLPPIICYNHSMKKLTLFPALVFSLTMFSSTCFAEWRKVGKDVKGNTIYVDLDRIRKVGEYVYFWRLHGRLKPTKYGDRER